MRVVRRDLCRQFVYVFKCSKFRDKSSASLRLMSAAWCVQRTILTRRNSKEKKKIEGQYFHDPVKTEKGNEMIKAQGKEARKAWKSDDVEKSPKGSMRKE